MLQDGHVSIVGARILGSLSSDWQVAALVKFFFFFVFFLGGLISFGFMERYPASLPAGTCIVFEDVGHVFLFLS